MQHYGTITIKVKADGDDIDNKEDELFETFDQLMERIKKQFESFKHLFEFEMEDE